MEYGIIAGIGFIVGFVGSLLFRMRGDIKFIKERASELSEERDALMRRIDALEQFKEDALKFEDLRDKVNCERQVRKDQTQARNKAMINAMAGSGNSMMQSGVNPFSRYFTG